ncbi:hypothetical protein CTAYLR_000812 [Chrysophaeum taylorii]|uniref:Uncharacterized protein n=1 Tax=Chrysophaeum taylorii TaxID=2483200 RepID=A0AAD7UR34_9STRA|nr:hypothetical protein CTAYLR_000812 [Chrysophaeum taylorii]
MVDEDDDDADNPSDHAGRLASLSSTRRRTVLFVSAAACLAVATAADGLLYIPATDFAGNDEITVSVRSSWGEVATSRVAVVVEPSNDAPELQNADLAQSRLAETEVFVGAAPVCVLDKLRAYDRDATPGPLTLSALATTGTMTLAPFAAATYGVQTVGVDPRETFVPRAPRVTLRAHTSRLNALLAACGLRYAPPRKTAAANASIQIDLDDGEGGYDAREFGLTIRPPRPPRLLDCGGPTTLLEGTMATPLEPSIVGGVDDAPGLVLEWSGNVAFVPGVNETDWYRPATGGVAFVSPIALRRSLSRGDLVYVPISPLFNGIDFATLRLTTTDTPPLSSSNSSRSSSSSSSSEAVCTVHVIPVNQAPTIAGPLIATDDDDDVGIYEMLAAGWNANEDQPLPLRGIVVEDVDDEDIAVLLTARNAGATLELTGPPTGIRVESFNSSTGRIQLSGRPSAVNQALDGLDYIPPLDFVGRATIAVRLTDGTANVTALALVDVLAVEDPPILTLMLPDGSVRMDEDTSLNLGSILSLTDVDSPNRHVRVRISADAGSFFNAAATSSHSVRATRGDHLLDIAGTTRAVGFSIADVLYVPDRDWHGVAHVAVQVAPLGEDEDVIDASVFFDVLVDAMQDDPIIETAARNRSVAEDETFADFADIVIHDVDFDFGWVATSPTAVASISVADPDSSLVTVELVASSGLLRTTRVDKGIEYAPNPHEADGFAPHLRLYAEIGPMNAALSSLVWVADQNTKIKPDRSDGLVHSSILVTATDREGASSTETIVLKGSPSNSVPRLAIDRDSRAHIDEDQGWTRLLRSAIVEDNDDDLLVVQASARDTAELEVHEIETRASSSRNKHAAVHVVALSNATNESAPVTSGYFHLTVNWSEAVLNRPWLLPAGVEPTMTTAPIAFDAVAKIADERRGAAGRARRDRPDLDADLTGESVEAKLRALTNVRNAGLDVLVSRDDNGAVDPYDAGDVRYHATRRGHVWRITFSGAPPALTNAPLLGALRDVKNKSHVAVLTRLVRRANALGGTFWLDIVGECCAVVAHNASARDMQRSVADLNAVAAVSVTRSATESAAGGFRWFLTFVALSPSLEPNATVRANPVAVTANGSRLTGDGATVSARLASSRVGTPSKIYHVETTARALDMVHAVTLAKGGPGFVHYDGRDQYRGQPLATFLTSATASRSTGANGSSQHTQDTPQDAISEPPTRASKRTYVNLQIGRTLDAQFRFESLATSATRLDLSHGG